MTNFFNYIERRTYLAHIIFWVSLFLIQTFGTETLNDYSNRAIHYSIILLPKLLAAYFTIYYLVPQFLFKKKYLVFIMLFLISSYLICVGARILVVYGTEELIRVKPFPQESIAEIFTDLKALNKAYFFGIYFPAFLMLMLKLLKESNDKRAVVESLKREKVSAELSFLKSQIHPHFLFNTLNNLYVLTLKKSDKAPETVLKLSEILDYMLYQCNGEFIDIEKEIQLIENYVALEQLRYGEKLNLETNITVDNLHTKITPLLLISIIENAFKHGVSGSVSKASVTIDVIVENKKLLFKITNTKPEFTQNDDTNFKESIGLTNTKKQLSLVYPNAHQMTIEDEKNIFTVTLKIDLN